MTSDMTLMTGDMIWDMTLDMTSDMIPDMILNNEYLEIMEWQNTIKKFKGYISTYFI